MPGSTRSHLLRPGAGIWEGCLLDRRPECRDRGLRFLEFLSKEVGSETDPRGDVLRSITECGHVGRPVEALPTGSSGSARRSTSLRVTGWASSSPTRPSAMRFTRSLPNGTALSIEKEAVPRTAQTNDWSPPAMRSQMCCGRATRPKSVRKQPRRTLSPKVANVQTEAAEMRLFHPLVPPPLYFSATSIDSLSVTNMSIVVSTSPRTASHAECKAERIRLFATFDESELIE